ncbi:hypothetical protein HHK36_005450 [Tetracentron sinense]|uniref:Diacylglycerol kinase n=1 Tax=Tetracentron sinense TaxID=13715 RepID=A0A834ZPG5_TETSI|nr:hypothetical protein HHK36_005450 [Tetracentron sinense]
MGDFMSKFNHFLKEFYIPNYILVPESKVETVSHIPTCPVIVFINSKSGGQLGGDLLITYRGLLNKNQVFDLGEEAPDKVLHKLYVTLEKLKLSGDGFATEIQKRLRIIGAGGDGTASWLLGVVCDLKLSHPPPIATVPLGTGNNLPFSFGWGKKNPGTDRHSVKLFLDQVMKAKEMKIDSWHILMRMRAPKNGGCDPVAPLELPHSLHAFHRVSQTDTLNMADFLLTVPQEGCHTFRGGFWNYFSMGMDAQVSYAFHSERKLHPEKFKNQLVNQSTYAKLGCTQGWFCASLLHPSSRVPDKLEMVEVCAFARRNVVEGEELHFSRNHSCPPKAKRFLSSGRRSIAQLAKVMIMKRQGQWEDLHIPQRCHTCVYQLLVSNSACICIGVRDLTPPFVDDGLLEVVGFRDAWHGLILLAPNGHGTRLAQAHRIRFEFHKGAADHTYMRIDGEPWKQPLPIDDDTVVVEISHLGQVNMLATQDCRSKSINEPVSPTSHQDEEDGNEYDSGEDWEERRKFGAADTFRIPDEVDITRLS